MTDMAKLYLYIKKLTIKNTKESYKKANITLH